jgi:DNA-binding response OmpR family regulator
MRDGVPRRAILCCEKDEATRDVLAQALGGYELVFTSGAFDTIREMHARPFDAYIIDYWLSDWSGPQLCRAIREVDPHCPVIFCTAAEGDLSKQRAVRAGGSAYFSKPVDGEKLKARLCSLFEKADAASLQAKNDMEAAIQNEIARCAAWTLAGSFTPENATRSLERTARSRAYKTFMAAGGCRAHFERWWPHLFGSARANHRVSA